MKPTLPVLGDAQTSRRYRQPEDLPKNERKIAKWLRKRRGILSQVAREMKVSPAHVQRVAYGRSTSAHIETRLRELGLPQ